MLHNVEIGPIAHKTIKEPPQTPQLAKANDKLVLPKPQAASDNGADKMSTMNESAAAIDRY